MSRDYKFGVLTSKWYFALEHILREDNRLDALDIFPGVPHGKVLGRVLFLPHIDDIANKVDTQLKVRLLYGDCLLYVRVRLFRDREKLNLAVCLEQISATA